MNKVLIRPDGLALAGPTGKLLGIDPARRATAQPDLAPRVGIATNSVRWAAVGQWDGLVASQRPDIVMPFPVAVNNYGPAADLPTYTLTFQVTGTPGEGVQVLGCCESDAPIRLWLDGKLLTSYALAVNDYTDLRRVLGAVWGLPAGTHTLGVQKLHTSGSYAPGVLIGGAWVYTRVSTYK